ncbi:MAG TPA: DUF1028 domain-containing protein [Kofleriaceae bacterium]
MRALLILIAVASCKTSTKPAPPSDDYCKGQSHYVEAPSPLGTLGGSSVRPTNTFSIVARDPITGDLGVAVQSHWFSVGSIVTWAEPGVGAVATQAFAEPSYGPKGLALMRDGMPPAEAIAKLTAEDPQQASRQLGFVDALGRAASHTGAKCIAYASSKVGDGYAVQANIMANDKVVPAMAQAFEATKGDLADRMLAALDAAQAAGGDLRGCQSAAMLVVSGKKSDKPWAERKIDLRVEDAARPLVELRRLVALARAYDHMNQGDAAMEKKDIAAAAEHYATARRMEPDNVEMTFWSGVTLVGGNQYDAGLPLVKQAFKADPVYVELMKRLVDPPALLTKEAAERLLRDAR